MLARARRAQFWLFSILLAFVALASGWAAAEDRHGLRRPFDRIVVFGTSLSDPGNAFAFTGQNLRPKDVLLEELLVPRFPYAKGGNHFSNGATWVEQLAVPLGLSRSVRPAYVRSVGKASNYAFGGARARGTAEGSLAKQLERFLEHVDGGAPSDALYVIEMGGNDIRDALGAAIDDDPTTVPEQILLDAAVGIVSSIGALHGAGARKFLLWNAPNVGRSPAIQMFIASAFGAATDASEGFNATLEFLLDAYQIEQLADIQLMRFNAFQALEDIATDAGSFGFADVTTACIDPTTPPFQCARPDRHFFWDGIHPTRAGHWVIAWLVGKALWEQMLQEQ